MPQNISLVTGLIKEIFIHIKRVAILTVATLLFWKLLFDILKVHSSLTYKIFA